MALPVSLPTGNYSTNEAFIHMLVDDILTYIFLLNATGAAPHLLSPEHETTVASSQVCRRWRSVALQCPRIWGSIIDYSRHPLKWIETLLDRSHPSPLDFGNRIFFVNLRDSYGRVGVLELVFNHIDRLRIFNLMDTVSSWELVSTRFLQLPAPNLEFVRVIIDPPVTDLTDIQVRQLTHPLFEHHAPNLQNLQLHRCMVDFTSPILTALTELYVHDIAKANAIPTVLDWLNILGGMPSLRWVTLTSAISSATTNDISSYPIIHLAALNMLSVEGTVQDTLSLVEHLIAPPRCGLRLRCSGVHLGYDQRRLWAIIKKHLDSWAKNAPNRHLGAYSTQDVAAVGNLPDVEFAEVWDTEASVAFFKQYIHLLDPVLSITLYPSNPEDAVPLFLSLFTLFERTFFDTTYFKLCIDYDPDDGLEVFQPLVDNFRGFVNLERLYLKYDSLSTFLFPLLQHYLPSNPILLPALQSLSFSNAMFTRSSSDSLFRVADFLRWRREQWVPVQKIDIVDSWIDIQDVITYFQDTPVDFNSCSFVSEEDEVDDPEDYVEEDDSEEDNIEEDNN